LAVGTGSSACSVLGLATTSCYCPPPPTHDELSCKCDRAGYNATVVNHTCCWPYPPPPHTHTCYELGPLWTPGDAPDANGAIPVILTVRACSQQEVGLVGVWGSGMWGGGCGGGCGCGGVKSTVRHVCHNTVAPPTRAKRTPHVAGKSIDQRIPTTLIGRSNAVLTAITHMCDV
jgi:hypothetical protein